MGRSSKEAELRRGMLHLLADQSDAPALPSVRDAATILGCSPTILYKYGLAQQLQRARRRASSMPGKIGKGQRELLNRLSRTEERAEWFKRAYEEGLSKLLIVEEFIRHHPELEIDLDAVYRDGLPRPDRREPRTPTARSAARVDGHRRG